MICPVYNEEQHIEKVLQFVTSSTPLEKEIIFIDGDSGDQTASILKKWQKTNPEIKILNNSRRTVPYALNLAIPICTGDYIVRLDAHSDYAPDYFEKIIDTFEKSGADIVGGPMRTTFVTPFQEAVAYIFNTPLGMGDSSFHNPDYEGYTDSVTFGSWKKEIFQTTGLFDTHQKRNQDDEFHYRAKSLGFKIYQSPDIKLFYYPRDSIIGLFKQYYEYGLYKPMVLKKIKSGIRPRHLIPGLFVIYLIMCLLVDGWVIRIPLFSYLSLCIYYTIKSAKRPVVMLMICISYMTVHIAYGLGFIVGLSKLINTR